MIRYVQADCRCTLRTLSFAVSELTTGKLAVFERDMLRCWLPTIRRREWRITIGPLASTFRFSVASGIHAEARISFGDAAPVFMALYVEDGADDRLLATTDAGIGIRVLSVLAQRDKRTFTLRVSSAAPVEATLRITKTRFCAAPDDRLLQLPVPFDDDGYRIDDRTIFRYQFGLPALLRIILRMGRQRVTAGLPPFLVYDLSQWNGETPGVDVGRPRHKTHRHGIDADIAIDDLLGRSRRRSFCKIREENKGNVCVADTVSDFGGEHTARNLAACFQSSRFDIAFLDRELIRVVIAQAKEAAAAGKLPGSTLLSFLSSRHLMHIANHTDHFHLRIRAPRPGTVAEQPEAERTSPSPAVAVSGRAYVSEAKGKYEEEPVDQPET